MLKKAIKDAVFASEEIYSVACKVIAVDTSVNTSDCQPLNGKAPVLGVRLQAAQGAAQGMLLLPEIGSEVVVSFLSPESAFVSLVSSVGEVRLTAGQTTVISTDAGLRIERAGQDLGSVLSDLIAAIKAITVSSSPSGGPTSTPLNAPAFDAISGRINQLLN